MLEEIAKKEQEEKARKQLEMLKQQAEEEEKKLQEAEKLVEEAAKKQDTPAVPIGMKFYLKLHVFLLERECYVLEMNCVLAGTLGL